MNALGVLMPVLAVWFVPPSQQGQQTDPCVSNPGGPKCLGRWMDPIDLCGPGGPIGCNRLSAECMQPACGDCTDPDSPACLCKNGDEISHAALIPSGPYAGHVLIWTKCDKPLQNPAFKTYFWDPSSQTISGEAAFPPGAADAFCAGHTWVLDADGKAKLFTIGGSFTDRAYWFDAETATWNPGSDPVDLGDPNYYPSIVTYGDDVNKTSVGRSSAARWGRPT